MYKKSTEFNFGVFEMLRKSCEDYDIIWAECGAKAKSVIELAAAIRGRVAHDRKANASRIAELEAQMSDTSRPDTVRRVAEVELNKLKALTFSPTDEEIAMLKEELELHEQAYADSLCVRKKMDTLSGAAKDELAKIITWSYGQPKSEGYYRDTFENDLRGSRNTFDRLTGMEVLR